MGRSLIIMLVLLVPVLRILKKDFHKGLAVSVALLVATPNYLSLSLGGGIPELTFHRVLLLCLFWHWMSVSKYYRPLPPAPFLRILLFLSAAIFMSFVFSIYRSGSLKYFLVFVLEVVVFFVIVSTSVRNQDDIRRILFCIAVGLGVVAVLAGIERHWEINWSRYLILGDPSGGGDEGDITATFSHRILLGYGMAIAVPIILASKEREQRKGWRRFLWVAMLAAVAGCYFANSRGPWLGLFIGTAPLVVLGSRETKRVFVGIALLGVLVVAVRPGVRETLLQRFYSTFDTDTVKGKSYEYRWMLWHVAYSEIMKSPERTLFGYGGLSTETMDLSSYFEKDTGEGSTVLLGHTSWDNQLACDLIELGLVGFLIQLSLYIMILWKLFGFLRHSTVSNRNLMLAFFSSCIIYIYATTNVFIFSPQLKFLFWGLVACGIRFGQLAEAEAATGQFDQSMENHQNSLDEAVTHAVTQSM